MESYYLINLVFIFAVNVFFFFSGICLNSLVILSFWRSVQLRKKLCYFTIMILSCCDLLAVLTNNPLMAFISMSWFTRKLDVNARWAHISLRSTSAFLAFSLFALLVMNFDRYEKDVFFEKCIELFASSRLCCSVLHSNIRLHWIKNKLARDNIYFG